MVKPSNGDPQGEPKPITSKEKQARIKKLQKMTTREMLMKLMEAMGDESISDDRLRRALIILEDLEIDENSES